MELHLNRIKWIALAVPLLQLTACTLGPDYVRPSVEAPAAFKEMDGWKMAQPRDQEIRGKWWEVFNDPLLNSLQEQVNISNQNLAQAEARYRQARALVQSARAAYFPTVSGSVSTTRSGGSSGRANLAAGTVAAGSVGNSHTLSVDVNWEADLWGKLRRTVEANQANAQASAADLEATRLSTQAQLAQSYFQLRTVDAQQQLFDRTVADYQRSVQLTQNQYNVGVVAKENVVLAQTQLKTTQAQAIDLGVQRAQLEHAIALLIGKAPSNFSLAVAPLAATVPPLPVGVPSALLERRPDIAAAERRVATANAQIGVAKTAYFPDLTLSAAGGFQSSSFANWLTLPNRFWSIGPAIAQTLFDAGARQAQTEQAIASYDANVAAYRQTVLTGFQEVEDNLAALRILEQEAQVQQEAAQLARQSVALATNQYRAGIVSYLNVVSAQTTALSNERTEVDLLNRRLAASVLLIKALGGGWNATALPQ
jgi:NodT family efflux transporter outer membrane factor (OMF) lipoprotein